jgi:hypothetical protein
MFRAHVLIFITETALASFIWDLFELHGRSCTASVRFWIPFWSNVSEWSCRKRRASRATGSNTSKNGGCWNGLTVPRLFNREMDELVPRILHALVPFHHDSQKLEWMNQINQLLRVRDNKLSNTTATWMNSTVRGPDSPRLWAGRSAHAQNRLEFRVFRYVCWRKSRDLLGVLTVKVQPPSSINREVYGRFVIINNRIKLFYFTFYPRSSSSLV